MRDYTRQIGLAMGVKGLFNIQYAIQDDVVYVLEVNPRASRTVPYVSKAVGYPLASYAAQIAAGKTLSEIGFLEEPRVRGFFVKEAVLPFQKFPDVDARLSPEMRSTGEVVGHAASFGHAFVKSQIAAHSTLPTEGTVLISVNNYDKGAAIRIARDLYNMGFELVATAGTAKVLELVDLPARVVKKISEGEPNLMDGIREGEFALIINTPLGAQAHDDGALMRSAAYQNDVPILTTLSAAIAAVQGIRALKEEPLHVTSLQKHHSQV